jgi:hypothetical protein
MPVVESFIVSIAANLATSAGRSAFLALVKDDSLYQRIETAYERALKQWTCNRQIVDQEKIWSNKRFEEVVNRILHPEDDSSIDAGTIELLTLFEREMQKDSSLWNHIQGVAFRQLIEQQNRTTNYLQYIIDEINSNNIDELELISRAERHVRFQITKNISSGKYIPDTFLEVDDLKDHVRYFAHPCLFYSKIFDEVSRFNFDDLHRYQTMNNKALFEFDVSEDKYKLKINKSISSCGKDLYEYVAKKHDELYSGGNELWVFRGKLNNKKEDLEFLSSQTLLLTAKAGQGKTNFLCDFTQNVLLKRDIPCLYLNGFEIDPNDVAKSFSRSLYNFYDYQFRDILNGFSNYCHSKMVPLILIIDGLNENPNPQLFCQSLEAFLRELLNYDFVKVLLTCRYEYFQHNYIALTQMHPGIKQAIISIPI